MQTKSESLAWRAAHKDGWLHWFGCWFFTNTSHPDVEYRQPYYFFGTARDLCLMHGIDYESNHAT